MEGLKMKSIYGFIDPGAIMGVVVSLIILAVGVFAFFVTINQVHTTTAYTADNAGIHSAVNNTTSTGNSVFNIIGIVLIIGAIMSIVGLVYNYVR
jgi:uncharacterized membrane protein